MNMRINPTVEKTDLTIGIDQSDVLFPFAPDVHLGADVCPSSDALCAAVEVWLHARPKSKPKSVRQAAAVFSVSVPFLVELFDNRCNQYFYIDQGPVPGDRIFLREVWF
jgi:hypothetical protein